MTPRSLVERASEIDTAGTEATHFKPCVGVVMYTPLTLSRILKGVPDVPIGYNVKGNLRMTLRLSPNDAICPGLTICHIYFCWIDPAHERD